ncbi:MAG TPA: DUF3999 family protein [Ohtaekwangia sp.]
MKRIVLITCLFLLSNLLRGQEFIGEALLPVVPSDGFYRILITPQLGSFLNAEFSNVRIHDNKGKEVPYLYQPELRVQYTTEFKTYEILEKKQHKNCCTTLLLQNPGSQPINNISLSIKNADVTKQATLLGSDDKENWFALKQHFTLSSINNSSNTSEVRIVDFPLSNYTYYQLQIEDSTSAPLNILSAGYYEVNSENGNYINLPLTVNKTDHVSQKKTYLNILFDSARVTDKFELTLTGAPYFLRRAELYEKKQRLNKKGEKETYFDSLYPFELSSKQPSVLELDGVKAKEFQIIISNDDNPSLEVASLKAYQLNRYLTTWLKKDETYSLKIGNTNLEAPVYDIAFFEDKIPDAPAVLSIQSLKIFEKEKAVPSDSIFTSNIIIWIAIGLVVVVLGFMAMKMANETSARNKS